MVLRLVQLGDVHLRLNGDQGSADQFSRLVAHVNGLTDVDGVVCVGDMTHSGSSAEYDEFRRLAKFRAPLFEVPGNHDVRQSLQPDEVRVVDFGSACMILVNSSVYKES